MEKRGAERRERLLDRPAASGPSLQSPLEVCPLVCMRRRRRLGVSGSGQRSFFEAESWGLGPNSPSTPCLGTTTGRSCRPALLSSFASVKPRWPDEFALDVIDLLAPGAVRAALQLLPLFFIAHLLRAAQEARELRLEARPPSSSAHIDSTTCLNLTCTPLMEEIRFF